MDAHEEYEKKLQEFNRRIYLTPDEDLEKKRLQKLKLAAVIGSRPFCLNIEPKERGKGLKKTGAEIVFESLKHEGVDTVFGCPAARF